MGPEPYPDLAYPFGTDYRKPKGNFAIEKKKKINARKKNPPKGGKKLTVEP